MPGAVREFLIALAACAALWPATAPTQARAQDEAAWQGHMSAAMRAHRQQNLGAAERNLRVALGLAEGFDPDDGRLAETLLALSTVRFEREDYSEVRSLLERTVEILERDGAAEGPPLGPVLVALAQAQTRLRNFDEADALYVRAVEAIERARGPEHGDVARVLENLAGLRMGAGRYDEAEPLYARALAIREQARWPDHPGLARTLESYAGLLRLTGRVEEAETLEARAAEILGN